MSKSLPTLLQKGSLYFDDEQLKKDHEETIPIQFIEQHIFRKLNKNIKDKTINDGLLLLKSETGSGKSTTLPFKLFSNVQLAQNKTIGVTQPKILTAIDIPKFQISGSSWAKHMVMGHNIGYRTGIDNCRPNEKHNIIFMTIQTLTNQFINQSDEWLINKYSIIIIDECHNKPIDLDLLIYLINEFINRNINKRICPYFILTSATFRINDYMKYFSVTNQSIIKVTGRSFPINNHFMDYGSNDLYKSTIKIIKNIFNINNIINDDIIVFLTGLSEIEQLQRTINKEFKNVLVLPIDGKEVKQQGQYYRLINVSLDNINNKQNKNYIRKIILSTNVAETGLTIDNLKFVIDSGWMKLNEFIPTFGVNILIRTPCSLANTLQRKGRCGRKSIGEFYPLYTENVYKELIENNQPDVYTSNISTTMLLFYNLAIMNNKIYNDNMLQLLDSPSHESINYSKDLLFNLGLTNINNKDCVNKDCVNKDCVNKDCVNNNEHSDIIITKIGEIINKLFFIHDEPNRIQLARMILSGYAYNVSIIDLINIAAILPCKQLEYQIKSKKLIQLIKNIIPNYLNFDIDNILIKLQMIICDEFIFPLILMKGIMMNITNIYKWSSLYGISISFITTVLSNRDDIINQLLSININPFTSNIQLFDNVNEQSFMNSLVNIKRCIWEGFKMNLFIWNSKDCNYRHYRYGKHIILNKISLLNSDTYKQLEKLYYNPNFRPKNILVYSLLYKEDQNSIVYNLSSSKISILDGFVQYDPNFYS